MKFSEGWMKKFKKLTFSAWNSFYQVKKVYWRIHSVDPSPTEISRFLREQIDWAHGIMEPEKSDRLMRSLLTQAHRKIKYVGDIIQWKMPEYWESYEEVESSGEADCDGMHIHLYTEAILHGINPERLYLAWGPVQGGNHCYLLYKRDSDGQEIPLDVCYYYQNGNIPLKNFTPYRDNPLYYYGKREKDRCNHLRGFGGRI